MVFLSMPVKVISAPGTTLVANSNVIPVGFRPANDVQFDTMLVNNNNLSGTVSRMIQTNGTVVVATTATGPQEFRGNASWITNDAWPAS